MLSNIDQILRRLVPNINPIYLTRRSILDYPSPLFIDFDQSSELITIMQYSDSNDQISWTSTLVVIGFRICEDSIPYNYAIDTSIYKLNNGRWISIGSSTSYSSIFYPISNAYFPYLGLEKYCCNGEPSLQPNCYELPFGYTFISQIEFYDVLSNLEGIITGSIDTLPFFNSNLGIGIPESTPISCELSQDRNWVALIVDSELISVSYQPCINIVEGFFEDYILESVGLSVNNVENYTEIITGSENLFSFQLDLVDNYGYSSTCLPLIYLIASVCDCCDCDLCSDLEPGWYFKIDFITSTFGPFKFSPPLSIAPMNILALLVDFIEPYYPGSIITYDNELGAFRITLQGVPFDILVYLCPCPEGTNWSLISQQCC